MDHPSCRTHHPHQIFSPVSWGIPIGSTYLSDALPQCIHPSLPGGQTVIHSASNSQTTLVFWYCQFLLYGFIRNNLVAISAIHTRIGSRTGDDSATSFFVEPQSVCEALLVLGPLYRIKSRSTRKSKYGRDKWVYGRGIRAPEYSDHRRSRIHRESRGAATGKTIRSLQGTNNWDLESMK